MKKLIVLQKSIFSINFLKYLKQPYNIIFNNIYYGYFDVDGHCITKS